VERLAGKELRVGGVILYVAHSRVFEVNRLRSAIYCLRWVGADRLRFGSLDEIRQDIEYTRTAGCLPRAATNVH
jgi:hypothetical protein